MSSETQHLPEAQLRHARARRKGVIRHGYRYLFITSALFAAHSYVELRHQLVAEKEARAIERLHQHIDQTDRWWATVDCLGDSPKSYCM